MEYFRENTIKVIKDLIKNCHNAEKLLRNSCSTLENNSLHKIFLYYADLNKTYINKLENEILRLGGSVDEFYLENVPPNVDKINYLDKLKICENGMNTAVNNYKEITLREDILWEVVPIISQQYYGEVEAHETIKNINTQVFAES
jgi:hypothetical protein